MCGRLRNKTLIITSKNNFSEIHIFRPGLLYSPGSTKQHFALGKNYLLHLKRSKGTFRNTLFLKSLIAS